MKLEVTETRRADGKRDIHIEMSEDVLAHLQHRVGQERKHPDCQHCVETLRVYKAVGL